jgi:predicted O-methyltransferase YrrM
MVDAPLVRWQDACVDTRRFGELLPSLFESPQAVVPRDRRFRALMDDVEGMASENKLALLNLAARLLPEDEAYVEVGSWKGLSTIAAVMGNEAKRFYAIDKFRECGSADEILPVLRDNLERWGASGSVSLIQEDAFRALRRAEWLDRPIGVYFYDGDHGRLAHYLALGMAEPWLADEALVVLDDTSWPVVASATDSYVGSHDGYELLFDFESDREFDPRWWNGVRVYRYCRPSKLVRGPAVDLLWRRTAHLYAYDPVTWALFRAARNPTMGTVLRRVLPVQGRRVKASP